METTRNENGSRAARIPAAYHGEPNATSLNQQNPVFVQYAIITLSWVIYGLLIHQQRVDHAADFNQLLPVATVACESRHFAGGHCAYLAHAHLRHHAFESGSCHRSCSRATEIFVNDFHVPPAQRT